MSIASIDVHSHALPKSYIDALAELGVNAIEEDGFPTPTWSEESHLRFMDETDQAFSILTISTPHINRGDDALSAHLARTINDELAAICSRNPDRLGFATTLPIPAVEASIEEARRGFDELGAIGVKVPSNGAGIYLGDPSLEPLMAFLNERNAIVTIHPSLAPASPEGIFTAGPAPLFEYIVDTTRAVLNLMAHGVIDRYPYVRWIVPHAGSFLPPIAHRLMGISKVLVPAGLMEPINVMDNLKSLYWDLAGDARPVMLEGLMMIADPTHLLYGSDTPYTPTFAIAKNKEGLAEDPQIAPIVEDVFYNNAARLYGLDL